MRNYGDAAIKVNESQLSV